MKKLPPKTRHPAAEESLDGYGTDSKNAPLPAHASWEASETMELPIKRFKAVNRLPACMAQASELKEQIRNLK